MENMTKEAWAAKIQSLYNQFIEQRAYKPAAATAKSGEEKAEPEKKEARCTNGRLANLPKLGALPTELTQVLTANGALVENIGKSPRGKAVLDAYADLQTTAANLVIYAEINCTQAEADKLHEKFIALQKACVSCNIYYKQNSAEGLRLKSQSENLIRILNAYQANINANLSNIPNLITNPNVRYSSILCLAIENIEATNGTETNSAKQAMPIIENMQNIFARELEYMNEVYTPFAAELKAYAVTNFSAMTTDAERQRVLDGIKSQFTKLLSLVTSYLSRTSRMQHDAGLELTLSPNAAAAFNIARQSALKNTNLATADKLSPAADKWLTDHFQSQAAALYQQNVNTLIAYRQRAIDTVTPLAQALINAFTNTAQGLSVDTNGVSAATIQAMQAAVNNLQNKAPL